MPQSSNSFPLHSRIIMVTRPAHQTAAFCALLEQAGATVRRCPVLRICDPVDTRTLQDCVARLDEFDLLMFNSPNAAERGISFIHAERRLPAQALIAAIGSKTAQVIEGHGYHVDLCPSRGFDSETFLQLPAIAAMQGKRVAIFRGQSGRALLADTLRERGAVVEFITTYRRLGPDGAQAAAIREALQNGVDAVTVTSSEALLHLHECLDDTGRALIRDTTLISGHRRITAQAQRLGLTELVTAADPTDESMLAAVLQWGTAQAH